MYEAAPEEFEENPPDNISISAYSRRSFIECDSQLSTPKAI